jgi:glucokinase
VSEQRRIVLDIGGSSIKSGRVCGREVFGFRTDPYDARADGQTVLAAYRQVLRTHLAAAEDDIGGVVLAHPGPFDYERGICLVRGVAKLEGLYGVDIGAALGPDLPAGCGIRFVNDAAAAIRGEARFGAGRPYRRLIGVTLGTGFGSAYVKAGEIVNQGEGVAGEGELYNLPWRDGIADEHFSTRGLIGRLAEDGFTGRAVHDIDEERHAEGLAAFGSDLGEFLAPLAAAFTAECVLILGGIANLYPYFGPALESRLPVRPLRGELGANAPLLGA